MAKKKAEGVNKSAAIREYTKAHPKAKPAQIAAALKEQGVEVTAGYVSSIKTASKKKRGKAKTKRKAAAPKGKSGDTTPAQDVMSAGELMYQAVDLVMKAGFKEAKSLVEVAGKMVSKIRG